MVVSCPESLATKAYRLEQEARAEATERRIEAERASEEAKRAQRQADPLDGEVVMTGGFRLARGELEGMILRNGRNGI